MALDQPVQANRPAAGDYDQHLDRLLALSDGVFAIALTLLSIDLHLPETAASLSGHDLFTSLLDTWPKLLSYVTSFTVIAIYWIAYHRVFHLVRRLDGPLLGLTLVLLAFIAFIPFPTSVLGQHVGDAVAQEFYYGSVSALSIVSAIMWQYASAGHRLVDRNLSLEAIRYYRRLAISAPAFFLLMMVIIATGLGKVINPLIVGYLLGLSYAVLLLVSEERWSAGRVEKAVAADPGEPDSVPYDLS
ncbi:MAG TPA: TMEM175 family protein [Thermomicrobiaceae bacterium]|nr:TMEM175 family protein [Thermomicrobiaceae bacterium]